MPDQECKWDDFKNDKMGMKKLLNNILRKNFTKIYMQVKMKSRLEKIKELLGCKSLSELKSKSKVEVQKMV